VTRARPFARVVRAFGSTILAVSMLLIALIAVRRIEVNRAKGSSAWLESGQMGVEEDHAESSVVRSFRVPAGVRLMPVTRQWGWLSTTWDFPPRRYVTIPLWMIAGAGAIIAVFGHVASRASGTIDRDAQSSG